MFLGLGVEEFDMAHAIKYKRCDSVTKIKRIMGEKKSSRGEGGEGSPTFLLLVGDEKLQLQFGVLFILDYSL